MTRKTAPKQARTHHAPKNHPMCSPSFCDLLKETVFPWMKHLAPDEQQFFVAELVFIVSMAFLKNSDKIERLFSGPAKVMGHTISSWKSTALIYADPKLARELKRPLKGTTRRVPRP